MEYNELLKKICDELKIKLTLISDGWVKVLERDNKIHYIQGYKFDLNNYGIGSIMDDKGLFYDLLKLKKLPIIEHQVYFRNDSVNEILDYFNRHNKQIIVKGNLGTCGRNVFLVENEDELIKTIDKLFLSQNSISLCPYYDIINEYRVIVLNGQEKIIYGKIRPEVIGDGKSTVYELACKFNAVYEKKKELIKEPNYIPKMNEKVILNYQFNLSNGAKMFLDIEDELKEKIISLAKRVANITNITFGSVDIIYTTNHELLVMEANSGVMMDSFIRLNGEYGYNKAYNLYREAIMTMFDIK